MAPEIVQKTEFCGPPTDIYASGVLLFVFFCGQFPYKGSNDKDLYSKIAAEELVKNNTCYRGVVSEKNN